MESAFRDGIAPGLTLFETFRWTPSDGVHLRARHLDRLTSAALRLGIVPRGVEAAMDAVTGDAPLRVRLDVALDGTVSVKTAPYHPLADGTVWRLAFSDVRLASGDPWLGVKTSRRAVYDAARATLPEGTDEVIFLNERGEVCEGAITSVFADFGRGMVTPPLACGVLPGVLRADLLDSGKASTAIFTPDDLRKARRIWVGNALRGLIPAAL
jgi:4-amino-4-deoxychorismate lyase